jgi:hypothetical protein
MKPFYKFKPIYFSIIDFDTISPTSGRPLLAAYILGMWGKYWQFLLML